MTAVRIIKEIKLVFDKQTIAEYTEEYFKAHPRAHVPPIKQPYHESINTWMIMRRPQMNALKGKWKAFITWMIERQGYTNLHIKRCELHFKTFYPNHRRHDIDNSVPKFIIDGLVESKFVEDDDFECVTKLTLECFIDTENPRTEIIVLLTE